MKPTNNLLTIVKMLNKLDNPLTDIQDAAKTRRRLDYVQHSDYTEAKRLQALLSDRKGKGNE